MKFYQFEDGTEVPVQNVTSIRYVPTYYVSSPYACGYSSYGDCTEYTTGEMIGHTYNYGFLGLRTGYATRPKVYRKKGNYKIIER